MSMIPAGATVLFQGDSITDAGRSRDDFTNLGRGCVASRPPASASQGSRWLLG